jgi:aspartyl protease family protein
MGGLALAVWALAGAFPGSTDSDLAFGHTIYLFALLALVSSGIVFGPRINFSEFTRNIAIWLVIVLALVLGFAFQDELRFVWQRVGGELVPGYAMQTEPGELVLTEGRDGHFHVTGQVNGVQVTFLVDTGASDTVLSPADAARTGYDLSSLDFSRVYQTANGLGTGAPVTLDTLIIGSLEFRDFPASINGEEMDSSLLGMSFLRTLESFEVRDRRLYLRW